MNILLIFVTAIEGISAEKCSNCMSIITAIFLHYKSLDTKTDTNETTKMFEK